MGQTLGSPQAEHAARGAVARSHKALAAVAVPPAHTLAPAATSDPPTEGLCPSPLPTVARFRIVVSVRLLLVGKSASLDAHLRTASATWRA